MVTQPDQSRYQRDASLSMLLQELLDRAGRQQVAIDEVRGRLTALDEDLVGLTQAAKGLSPAMPCDDAQAQESLLPDLLFEKVETLSGYQAFLQKHARIIQSYRVYEHALRQTGSRTFQTGGFCYCCYALRAFEVDYLYSGAIGDVEIPNWRERLVCTCGLNNRMRAAYHFVVTKTGVRDNPSVYISEQTTQLYRQLKGRFPTLVGSEFLGENIPLGSVDARQIRHEDATHLTFEEASFELYLSFEVFEHIPDYVGALREAFRVLKPKGLLIFTVPFYAERDENVVRATVRPDGSIHHLLPEEIHGDPVRKEGALCFYHFGWQLLRDLEAVGFKSRGAYFYLSRRYGYLGGPHMIFCAEK